MQNQLMQLFYVCYSMIAVFILLNMVVAVLDNSIHSAQEKYENEKDKLAVYDFIKNKAATALVKLGKENELDRNIKEACYYIDGVAETLDEVYEEELKGRLVWYRFFPGRGLTFSFIGS